MKTKQLSIFFSLLLMATISFGQFADTAGLNNYIKTTIKDKRPEKVTAEQIQNALLGAAQFLTPNAVKPNVLNDSIAAALKKVEKGFDISQHGADRTGTYDVSGIVQNAINAGYRVIYAPTGKYLISNPVYLKDSVAIVGDGRANTLFKLTSNITAFNLGFVRGGKGCEFTGFSFLGSNGTDISGLQPPGAVSLSTTDQRGIFADSVNGVLVHNVGGYKMGGYVVTFKRSGYCCTYYTNTGTKGCQVSDCYFTDSYGGVLFDSVAEYSNVSGTTVNASRYGVKGLGGNNRIIGCNLSNNTYGLYLGFSSNDGHGIASGNTINHCDTILYVKDVERGFNFEGNCMGVGNISLINSNGLAFSGGFVFSSGGIKIDNCVNTTFTNVKYYLQSSPTWTVTGEAPTVIMNGKTAGALSLLDVKNVKQFDIGYDNGTATLTGATSINVPIGNVNMNSGQFKVVYGANEPIGTFDGNGNTGFSHVLMKNAGVSGAGFVGFKFQNYAGDVAWIAAGNTAAGNGYADNIALQALRGNLILSSNTGDVAIASGTLNPAYHSVFKAGGQRLLVNTTTDDAANALQVNGSAVVSGLTNTGAVYEKVTVATDADYTVTPTDHFIILPDPAATRTITLPTTPGAGQVRVLVFRSNSTSSARWNFNVTVKGLQNDITLLPNNYTTTLYGTNGVWYSTSPLL